MEIFNAINDIIINEMGFVRANLKLNSNFKEDIGMDSLDLVELTVRTESQFHIDIEDEAAINIKTMYDLVSFVQSKTKRKTTS